VKWYPAACPVCGGDLHDDLEDRDWVACAMCARSFRATELLAVRALARAGIRGGDTPPSS
jgi:hypothetical protein